MKYSSFIFCAGMLLMCGCASGPTSSAGTKTHTLPSWGDGAPRLQIDVPSGFAMRRHAGPDFDVCYFSDASTNCTLGVYTGHNPDLRSDEAGVTGVQRQSGRIGDLSVEWLRWAKDGSYHSETLVRGFFSKSTTRGVASLVVHIFVRAPTQQDVVRMETAAATLRLEKAK